MYRYNRVAEQSVYLPAEEVENLKLVCESSLAVLSGR
jgi:hypothetical protein